ncbi:MAG: twin-arginine translocase TatA/TatE family subunit [PVC group bacterium]|nr:twin-arginine translocase TatA/TatE family subunit [PVC group bacterium]
MGRFGVPELVLILIILLLLFGASKLPQMARALGESIKEFKKSVNNKEEKPQEKKEDS